ncbi:gamma-glutamyltransferase 2 [Hasllibacter halocynthiae]|uniref:Gamma-glutamyltransferase 2 n=1 Tax=Hasllibacter halocynthiae TaxID=595589 RepID=A0A2T0X1E6_9RHOB|nr:gamma-glutamyltransferase family protein [Hasllibacter halocynthiae]PRY92761.1 gamma-glutamyltransferase 2 [Hasllibacter halocynthiae]
MRDFHLPGRSTVHADNGMCATSHPLAALAAVDVLRAGGTAADAAVAAAFLLGLCEPQMTGPGGDMFALVKPAGTQTVRALNGSGRGPAGLDPAALRASGHDAMPLDAACSVTMPGAVDGLAALHAAHGRLPWADLLAPAIRAAHDGVPVAPRTAADWQQAAGRLQGAARAQFLVDGAAPRAGMRFRDPKQAALLEIIAREGRAGFYEGAVAADIVASLRALGGTHGEDDLAAVRATWHEPIQGPYRGADLIEHPPCGQGAAAILLARILARFDVAALDPLGPERVHLEAEATKLAYDARDRFVADDAPAHRLTDEATADALAALIDPARAMPDARAATDAVHKDTVYLTVVDADRMAVSLICSIFHSFGAGLASDRFGVLFQNRGAGFTLEEGHPNEAAPGRRPMHTIIPAMLARGGRVEMPFGVMGGQYQAAGHVRFASNLLDFGMDPQEAIDAPRAFATGGGLQLERGYPPKVRDALAALGHRIDEPPTAIGGAQAIVIEANGTLTGASDPRKDGCALGY